jgi:hypothetical protein
MATFSHNPFFGNYWRILFRRVTWRQAGFALRRLFKDKRAIRYVGGLALQVAMIPLALVGVGSLLALTFLVDGPYGITPAFGLIGLLIGFCIRGLRISYRQKEALAKLPQPLSDDRLRATHAFFSDLAVIFAILSYRANSEAFLKQKVLPEHMQVISRQKHMNLIRERKLWDKLLPEEKRALMMPDGEWAWPLINDALMMQEQLRLARWILRLDFFLPDIGSDWTFDAWRYKKLIQRPEMLAEESKLIRSSNVTAAVKTAQEMHLRCFAEEVHRGYRLDAPEQTKDWARGVCERLGGKQSDDYVVGARIVSDLSEQDLRFITALAGCRKQFLEWTERILNGEEEPTRIPSEPPPYTETSAT